MIRLSKTRDYGIVLMAHLAACGEHETQNAREVAARTQLPLPMVSKILKSLSRQGLLESHRGSKGGYALSRRPEEVSAAEMITALEGPIGLTECSARPGQCSHELSCHVREPWQRINRVVWQALSQVTLADLARPGVGGPLLELAATPSETRQEDPHV